jgi:sarcosine oxidase gamma subunit
VIDGVTFTLTPACDLLSLDLWEGDLPDLGLVRALRVEPTRWWLVDAGDRIAGIAAALGTRGAITPFGGGMVRATLTGPGWRDLLSVSGFFDTEDQGFGPGQVASTVIHHVPVRIAPLADDVCELFCPASLSATLADLWRDATITGSPGG